MEITREVPRVKRRPFAETADALVDLGYSPIPIIAGEKRPAIARWQRYCRQCMAAEDRERFARSPLAYGVGLALGWCAVAVDVDSDDDDVKRAIRSVIEPSIVAKRGAKGSTHLYRPASPGMASRRFIGRDGGMLFEILAAGTQTVLPPSRHPSGVEYQWLGRRPLLDTPAADLPALPADVAQRLKTALRPWLPEPAAPRPDAAPPPSERPERYLDAAVRGVAADMGRAAEGGRNHLLNRCAFRLGQLGLGLDEAARILLPPALGVGLQPREIEQTIRSGWRAGAAATGGTHAE